MLLLLIRHGIAADQDDEKYPDDTLRPLTPKGRKIQRRLSRRLVKARLVPDRIFSSPWKRAWQTARILVDEAGLPKQSRIVCQALAQPVDLAAFAKEIGQIGADERLALVGHEPWMSKLAAVLLAGDTSNLSVDFPKSGVLGIQADELAAGAGTLWFFWRF